MCTQNKEQTRQLLLAIPNLSKALFQVLNYGRCSTYLQASSVAYPFCYCWLLKSKNSHLFFIVGDPLDIIIASVLILFITAAWPSCHARLLKLQLQCSVLGCFFSVFKSHNSRLFSRLGQMNLSIVVYHTVCNVHKSCMSWDYFI